MRDDTLILCYHAVSRTWPSELAVEPEALRSQLRRLLDDGYRPLTFTDAVLANPGGRVFAATFDDAYKSVFDLARPILAELGVPGTLYVPTDFPESGIPFPLPGGAWIGTEHESELYCMDWDEVRQLRAEGWEIGAHTCSHPWLTQVPDERLERELVRSREICAEQLRESCRSIAYPYGNHDDRVVAATAAAGFEAACTVPHRFEEFDDSPLRYARIDVTRSESPLAFRVRTSPWSRRARTTGAARAGHWLDTHRPRRSNVLGALDRRRRGRALAAALESFGGPRPSDLERFGLVFVDQSFTHHFGIEPGDVVLDVGPGDELFATFARERGCGRVVSIAPDAGNELDLEQLIARAAPGPVGFLKLEDDGGAAAVMAASDRTLAEVERLVVSYDPAGPVRVDQLVHRLQRAGFETRLDLDEASGAGYVSSRRARGAAPTPAA